MNCKKCGTELLKNFKFCPFCGAPQNGQAVPPEPDAPVQQPVTQSDVSVQPQIPTSPQKNRSVYQLLALFFGGLGIHNFYAGYAGRGFVQLILCWTGISSLWAFIEIFTVSKDAQGVVMVRKKDRVFGMASLACASLLLLISLLQMMMLIHIRPYPYICLFVCICVVSALFALLLGNFLMPSISILILVISILALAISPSNPYSAVSVINSRLLGLALTLIVAVSLIIAGIVRARHRRDGK